MLISTEAVDSLLFDRADGIVETNSSRCVSGYFVHALSSYFPQHNIPNLPTMLRHRSNEDVKLVIDDNSTSVTYSGEWGAESSYADYYQAYGLTMHYTMQPNAVASISFYGSYITVFGIIPSSSDLKSLGFSTTGSQVAFYQFDDGPPELVNVTLDAYQHFTDQVFFQPNTTQSDGYHTLVITNLVGMLMLDYFTVVPANSGSSPYIQKIDDASPIITYNNVKPFSNTIGVDLNSTLHSLPSPQSTASLNFKGTFVAVYCVLPPGTSLPVVSFTLDGSDPLVATGQGDLSGSMPRLSASRKQRLSQVLFWKSSSLANGPHNLLITATQGELLLDFILIQTLDGAESGTTVPSQSPKPTTPYVPSPSSTNANPYGNATYSGSVSRSPTAGTSSNHTQNTSVIVGAVVGFVVLLLALYMTWNLFKRKSGLRSKTQSNPDLFSQPPAAASLPVTSIAMAGNPDLVDGSSQHVTGYILKSSLGSVPPPRRSNTASLLPLPQDLTWLSLPTNSHRMSGTIAARYINNSCLPVRPSMLDTRRSPLPFALPPANRSSTSHGPYQGYERTLVTQRPPLPPSLLPVNRSNTGHGPHPGYERMLYTQRPSLPPSLPRANSDACHGPRHGDERILEIQRPSLLPPLPPANRSSTGYGTHHGYEAPVALRSSSYQPSTGHGSHQGYEHTPDTQRPSLPPSVPPTYRSNTGYSAHQRCEHTMDTQRPSLLPSLPPTYRSSINHSPHQVYGYIHRPSLSPSLPPMYRSGVGHGSQGYEPYEEIVKD